MEYIPITMISPEVSDAIRQAFVDNMDQQYTLIHTDYRDTYNDAAEEIQLCLDRKDTEIISNNQWEADRRYEGSTYELEELQKQIFSDKRYEKLHPFIEEWLEDENNKYFIIDTIEERDVSTPIAEMLKRSRLRGRVTLYTNYDCFPHNYDMRNTYSYTEYFKDIVDILCLNPAVLKEVFLNKGINTAGRWPDKDWRNNKEAVSYVDLADEMLNQCCYGLLTFMGMMPLTDLYEHSFAEHKTIIIPQGNTCGMFNDWNGGGSLMGMPLLRDLYLPVTFPRKTKYDKCRLLVDEPGCGNGYSIDEVYGLIDSAWGEEFKLIYK